jgi:hypothetical protein
MTTKERIAEGERLRDIGMALAASRRPDRVTIGRWSLAVALLKSPTSTGTIDDATPPGELDAGYPDGGRWRGTVTRSMIADGYAEIVGTTRSVRPSRHRGYIAVLRVKDRPALLLFVERMAAAFQDKTTPPVAADGVALIAPKPKLSEGKDHDTII